MEILNAKKKKLQVTKHSHNFYYHSDLYALSWLERDFYLKYLRETAGVNGIWAKKANLKMEKVTNRLFSA